MQPKNTSLGYGHHWFIEALKPVAAPKILELGTRRVAANPSTVRRDWVPHAAEYVCADFEAGLDVDVVADIHRLSQSFPADWFDGVIACSTFEHVQYPWLAVVEIAKVMRPGGLIFVQTHHSYPLHGFPNDYWRYTEAALAALFCERAGFETISTTSDIPCRIVADGQLHLAQQPAFLNVLLIARKISAPAGNPWRE